MTYQYNNGVEYDPVADSEHEWEMVERVYPNRTPIYNQENISSSQAGTPLNDPYTRTEPRGLGIRVDGLQLTTHVRTHALSSYPSSSADSIRAPDGPEIRDPGNKFLTVAPDTGLGEPRHRRRASIDEAQGQVSYTLREWAKNLPVHERLCSLETEWDGGGCMMQGGAWLPLGTHIVAPGPRPGHAGDSGRATRGKSSGSTSVLHGSVYSGGSSGARSSNVESLVSGIGTWVGESVMGGWPDYIDEEALQEEEEGNV